MIKQQEIDMKKLRFYQFDNFFSIDSKLES